MNATLYRSAQPSRDGFAILEQQASLASADPPIRTVVSLRAFNDDAPLVPASNGLHLEQIAVKTWHPENEDVIEFLRIVTTPALQPVLVHCRHGSDRTGMMVAIYRIVVEGWTKAQATDEMVHGGYGFHPVWQNLIRYIDELDVEAIKAELASKDAAIPLPAGAIQVAAGTEQWLPGGPTLPPGAEIVRLEGDPKQAANFTIRLKLPAGTRLPPHWHPRDERITVLSGVVKVGFGDTFDETAMNALPAGSFYVNPAQSHHYILVERDAVMQLTAAGPWEINFLIRP